MGWVSVTVCVSVVLMLMVVVDIQLVSGVRELSASLEGIEPETEAKVVELSASLEGIEPETEAKQLPPSTENDKKKREAESSDDEDYWVKKGRKRRTGESIMSDPIPNEKKPIKDKDIEPDDQP